MSSDYDREVADADIDELSDLELPAVETPPEAFYLALKQALVQLKHHVPTQPV
jgi:hypothetical protein